MMKKINKRARRRSLLPRIDREYGLYEIAIITRAGTAKALGLKQKGNLAAGADADITIYDLNPERTDLSKKHKTVRKAFQRSAYTIKRGEIVAKNGMIVNPVKGKTFWVDVRSPSVSMEVSSDMKRRFREYWTVQYENYPIPESYLGVSAPVPVKAEV
jgi:formylmethanofuran dehydrogenase subunit A